MGKSEQISILLQKTSPKVLIVLLGSIGDVVRGLPLAMRLKQEYLHMVLHWAIEPKSLGVLEGHPAIDKIMLFDRPRGFKAYLEFISRLRAENYDLVLDLQRHFKSGVTSFATGARSRVGFARQNAKECNWLFNNYKIEPVENFSPKIYHYQKFGDLLVNGANSGQLQFGLKSSESDLISMSSKLSEQLNVEKMPPFMGLILGSSWPSRFWFAESYARLIEEVYQRYGIVPVLIGGQAEFEFKQQLLALVKGTPCVDFVAQVRLAELKHLFRLIKFAVGSDSGPMHICAAVGTPVISLWGSTSPERSAPYGNENYVLHDANVSCSPCYLRQCPGLGQVCMKQITPDLVLEKVAVILANLSIQ